MNGLTSQVKYTCRYRGCLSFNPEAIAFSIIAGVDPMVGLYASFIIAVVTAIVGGRPAMISQQGLLPY